HQQDPGGGLVADRQGRGKTALLLVKGRVIEVPAIEAPVAPFHRQGRATRYGDDGRHLLQGNGCRRQLLEPGPEQERDEIQVEGLRRLRRIVRPGADGQGNLRRADGDAVDCAAEQPPPLV